MKCLIVLTLTSDLTIYGIPIQVTKTAYCSFGRIQNTVLSAYSVLVQSCFIRCSFTCHLQCQEFTYIIDIKTSLTLTCVICIYSIFTFILFTFQKCTLNQKKERKANLMNEKFLNLVFFINSDVYSYIIIYLYKLHYLCLTQIKTPFLVGDNIIPMKKFIAFTV